MVRSYHASLISFSLVLTFLSFSNAQTDAPNLTAILEKGCRYTTFIHLLKETQLDKRLNSQLNNSFNGMTVFAPSDNAFNYNLKADMLNSMTQQELVSIVLYHFLPRYYTTEMFQTASNPVRTQAYGGNGVYDIHITSTTSQVHLSTGVVDTAITNILISRFPLAVYSIEKVLLPYRFLPYPQWTLPPAPAPAPISITHRYQLPRSKPPAQLIRTVYQIKWLIYLQIKFAQSHAESVITPVPSFLSPLPHSISREMEPWRQWSKISPSEIYSLQKNFLSPGFLTSQPRIKHMARGKRSYWLLKTEPSEWSWDDQRANEGILKWDGVRNRQALNRLMSMRLGDLCFFYHSGSGAFSRHIIAVVQVIKPWYLIGDGYIDVAVDLKEVGEMRLHAELKKIKKAADKEEYRDLGCSSSESCLYQSRWREREHELGSICTFRWMSLTCRYV